MTESELNYRIQAISTALDSWNDTEALRLLRSSWTDIKAALNRPTQADAAPRQTHKSFADVTAA